MDLTVHVSDHIDAQTARQIQSYFNGLSDAQKQHVGSSKNSFAYWLNNRAPQLYRKVANYIDELWEQIESALAEILEGLAVGVAVVVAAPFVIAAEGIKAIDKWLNS